MKQSLLRKREGSAVIGAIIIAIIIGVWVAGSMQSSMTEYKMSKRYLEMQSTMNVAEAGLEEGVRAYRAQDWSGWTTVGSKGRLKLATMAGVGAGGSDGQVRIYVNNDSVSPSVVSEGVLSDAFGGEIRKQVRVDMSRSTLFANGMLGRDSVKFNGNKVRIASFDSRDGDASLPGGPNFRSNGHVATLGVENGDPNVNNADIYGFVATGKSEFNPELVGSNGFIKEYGSDISGIDWDRVTTDFFADLPPVPMPNYPASGLTSITATTPLGDPLVLGQQDLWYESIDLSGHNTLTINGNVRLYVSDSVKIAGNSQIIISSSGSLELYVKGDVNIAGNGVSNTTKSPEKMMIYGVAADPGTSGSRQSIDISGNGAAYAVVYAPEAHINMNGGGSSGAFWGAVVGYSVTLNGHFEFYYDEALRDLHGGGGMNIKLWRELTSSGDRLDFGNTSSLPSHF